MDAARIRKWIREAYEHAELSRLRLAHAHIEKQLQGPAGEETLTRENGTRDAKTGWPVNKLGEMVRTYLPHIAGESIEPSIEPDGVGDRGAAKLLELRVGQVLEDAAYTREDEQGVIASLLTIGCWWVGRYEGPRLACACSATIEQGAPMIRAVRPEHLVVDPSADRWSTINSIGDWYPAERDVLVELARQGLIALTEEEVMALPLLWDIQNGSHDADSVGALNDGQEKDKYLIPLVGLWEVTYREMGVWYTCTVPSTGHGLEKFVVPPTPVDPAKMPEGYPYVTLLLDPLTKGLVPTSPALAMLDAHHYALDIARKAVEQIQTLRRRHVVQRGSQIEKAMNEPGDEKYIAGDPKEAPAEVIEGGLTEEAVQAYAFLEKLGSTFGPNIELAGGKGSPEETAAGTSLLAGQGAIVLGRWTNAVLKARAECVKRVAAIVGAEQEPQTLAMPLPDGSVAGVFWPPPTDLSYQRYRFRVSPTGGSAGMDPRARLRSLFELFAGIRGIAEFLVMLGQDPSEAFKAIADMSAMPEIKRLLPTQAGLMQDMQVVQQLVQSGQLQMGGPGGPTPPGQGPQTQGGQVVSDQARRVPV